MGSKYAVGSRQSAVMQGTDVSSALIGSSHALAASPAIHPMPKHSSLPTAHRPLPTVPRPLPTAYCLLPTRRLRRPGISLLEVLISMFVLLFGLMGVAAVFPVGNHFA